MNIRIKFKENRHRYDIKTVMYFMIPLILMSAFAVFIFLFYKNREGGVHPAETVVIAVPYSELVQDYETNYYTEYLTKKTGYGIAFVYLEEGYEKEHLKTILTSKNSNVDAVFLPAGSEIISIEEYQNYINSGLLAAPRDYLEPDSNLRGVAESYADADFTSLLGEDGKAYCFPSMDMARTGKNAQILWINVGWLTNLGITMPRTEKEFYDTLKAFKNGDPNGNGIADELPLVSCGAEKSFESFIYLLNAFVYYDSGRRLILPKPAYEKGENEALRAGIEYCAVLYEQGLLAGDCFSYTKKQLAELINDPADTVGAFTSHGIADLIYKNNPGVLANFVQLPPLSSDFSEKGNAVSGDIIPSIGGLIPSNSAHKEAVAKIMDVMLSEEASLIALYGEEGVDWRFSVDGELSTYGTRAKITTMHYLKGERQNKNYAGIGPLVAAAGYTDGVTWNGNHSMTEYIDARAVKTYEAYYPSDDFLQNWTEYSDNSAAFDFLYEGILSFIKGERVIKDDRDWANFLNEYGRLSGK